MFLPSKRQIKDLAMLIFLGIGSALFGAESNQPGIQENQNVHKGADQSQTVVMLGDSTTQCSLNKPGAKITDYVQAYLNTEKVQATIINSGKGSDTAKGACTRLAKDVFAHEPSVVTISFGLNDTGKSTPEEYRVSMEQLVQSIRTNTQAKIVLVTSTPFIDERHIWRDRFAQTGGLDQFLDANMCAAMRDLARKHNLPLCDLHDRFLAAFKKNPKLKDKLILPDGVHLTDKGNEMAAGYIAAEVTTLLKGALNK